MQAWLMAAVMLFLWATPAEAKRVALLKNPAADARLIAASLKQAGFDEVIIKSDLGKSRLEAELRSFGIRAEGAEVALIYYAGHGIEAGGQNYLIPVDAQLVRDRDLEVEATRLDTALLMAATARMRIIVLDACRNNPFTASMQRTIQNRAVGRGLAAIEPEGETLVVYAAKAGATAADGEGVNSPFAQALAKRLPQPGLEISLLFRAVRDDVLARTGRTQEPFTYGSLSGQAFYFRPAAATASDSGVKPAGSPALATGETSESMFWQSALKMNNESAYRSYLAKYPNGQFVGLAYGSIKKIIQPKALRGNLGIVVSDVDASYAAALGTAVHGEIVQQVAGNGPAFAGGIRPGDVIFKINDTMINREAPIASIVPNLLIGSRASVAVLRDGQRLITSVIVTDRASYGENTSDIRDNYTISEDQMRTWTARPIKNLGLSLALIDENTARLLGLGFNQKLFIVMSVARSGHAEARGLVRGDIITSFNNKAVSGFPEIDTIVADALRTGRSHMMIRVKRVNKNPLYIAIKIK
jgi:Caspase domain/PDZ domain